MKNTKSKLNDINIVNKVDDILYPNESLYGGADRLEDERMFEFNSLSPTDKLTQLGKEITIRVVITQSEIFRIGELIWIAKNICQQENIGYQNWIANNFDFSYDTAENFVNVFKNCYGYMDLVTDVSISNLYQISSAKIPEVLRENLIESGKLENMKGKNLKELIKKYDNADEEEREQILLDLKKEESILRQVTYTIVICEKSLKVLEDLKDKIESRGKSGYHIDFTEQVKTYDPLASEINSNLFDCINKAIDDLDNILKESREKLEGIEG